MPVKKTSIPDFVKAAREHVSKAAKAADRNRDGKISRSEESRLPDDVRDNFVNWRSATGTSNPGVKKFVAAFETYLTAQAKRVDTNRDGFLTKTNARRLPVDLRDNFATYLAKANEANSVAGKTHVELGREALTRHINDVLFNPSNEQGESFRDACLDGTTTGAHATKVKKELLTAAKAWNPETDIEGEWEKYEGRSWQAPGEMAWAGRFWHLYTEVKFMPGQQPKVYLEID